jgi:replicative DNA helicase
MTTPNANVIPIDAAKPQVRAVAADLDAERAVLGSVLISNPKLALVAGLLAVDDFLDPAHREIFEAMLAIGKRGQEVDAVLLWDELGARGQQRRLDGGTDYLLKLAHAVPTAENVGHYAAIVARKAAVRQLERHCLDIAANAETEPDRVSELVLGASKLVTEIAKGRRRPGVDLADIVVPLEQEFDARAQNKGRLVGLSWGLPSVDYATGGLVRGNLHIIAARTSLGKTAAACQVAITGALDRDIPCFYASLEMPASMLAERFFARVAQVDSTRLRTGDLDLECWHRITGARRRMGKPGRVVITRDRSLAAIMSQARAFRVEHPGQDILVVVDYLQLVRTAYLKGRSREQEVAEVSSSLKELAGELDCPVLALCQFNRGPEAEDRDPKVSDIRESGAIENDADVILFIVRKREDKSGAAWFNIAKSRNGETGELEMRWNGPTYTFSEVQGEVGTPDRRFPDA